jgi:two-component system nitrogen regulation response regulator GlnG
MLIETSTECRDTTPGSPSSVGEIPQSPKKSPPRRVLVVDDEPLVRWAIAETLRASGYQTTEAADAESVVRTLCDPGRGPDAVLLDLRLPDCDDFWLLAAIHQLVPMTPIILMTASATREMAAEARQLGACAVLSKPFDFAELESVLTAALK